ncbi:MAG: hypothetical protein IPK72_08570 [Candidatus Eisenbacteria bacterium]|nr:hypothetical protein [Candidatus Eisenbacteria bacterium]
MPLARSCDVYYYQVGIALGVDRLARFAEKCHMNERTGIDLPQERNNLIPTPEWYAERYGKAGVHKGPRSTWRSARGGAPDPRLAGPFHRRHRQQRPGDQAAPPAPRAGA